MENTPTINEKQGLPTIAELFSDNLELAFKSEQLNLLLNQEPKKEWIKVHPFIKEYRYLPIDKVEFLLKKIFKQYQVEITGQGTAFNGVYVTVRVHYLNPTTGTMMFHDGIGAVQLQTKKDTSPADLININNGAISMAFPIAKTIAVKDACDHFGTLFGANLNRKDVIPFSFDSSLEKDMLEKIEITNEMIVLISAARTQDELGDIWNNNPDLHTSKEFTKLLTQAKLRIKNEQGATA